MPSASLHAVLRCVVPPPPPRTHTQDDWDPDVLAVRGRNIDGMDVRDRFHWLVDDNGRRIVVLPEAEQSSPPQQQMQMQQMSPGRVLAIKQLSAGSGGSPGGQQQQQRSRSPSPRRSVAAVQQAARQQAAAQAAAAVTFRDGASPFIVTHIVPPEPRAGDDDASFNNSGNERPRPMDASALSPPRPLAQPGQGALAGSLTVAQVRLLLLAAGHQTR